MPIALYSSLVVALFALAAPFWLFRMATGGRYRAGLAQRLGRVPPALVALAAGREVIWLHAVSVGEILAASRLIAELEAATGATVVVSTTTPAGYALARQRLGQDAGNPGRVFFYPLDLAFAVRPYLRALKPRLLVLMESELWPRMIHECRRAGVPVAVVNARVSDRSYRRALRLRELWSRLLRGVTLFGAQSAEDARRLADLGAPGSAIHTTGNLKYDIRAAAQSPLTAGIRSALPPTSRVLVAGSTLPGEEDMLLSHWPSILAAVPEAVLILAPRHPNRFDEVEQIIGAGGQAPLRASTLTPQASIPFGSVLLLDTIGDLASVYGLAHVAFVGGSLIPRGGHNPLEPAQFGVPIVIGPSYENFREIVDRMIAADAIVIGPAAAVVAAITRFLAPSSDAYHFGQRARAVFEAQSGATARTLSLLTALVETPGGSELPRHLRLDPAPPAGGGRDK